MRNKKEPKNREISIIPPFFTRFVKTYLNILGFKLKKEALNDLIVDFLCEISPLEKKAGQPNLMSINSKDDPTEFFRTLIFRLGQYGDILLHLAQKKVEEENRKYKMERIKQNQDEDENEEQFINRLKAKRPKEIKEDKFDDGSIIQIPIDPTDPEVTKLSKELYFYLKGKPPDKKISDINLQDSPDDLRKLVSTLQNKDMTVQEVINLLHNKIRIPKLYEMKTTCKCPGNFGRKIIKGHLKLCILDTSDLDDLTKEYIVSLLKDRQRFNKFLKDGGYVIEKKGQTKIYNIGKFYYEIVAIVPYMVAMRNNYKEWKNYIKRVKGIKKCSVFLFFEWKLKKRIVPPEYFAFIRPTEEKIYLLNYLKRPPEQYHDGDEIISKLWKGETVFERIKRDDKIKQFLSDLMEILKEIKNREEKVLHLVFKRLKRFPIFRNNIPKPLRIDI